MRRWQLRPEVLRWVLGRRLVLAVGLALVCLSSLAAVATAAAASPRALFRLLKTRPFPDSALPQGFSSATISWVNPSKAERKQHAIGGVFVSVRGLDAHDSIAYGIFQTTSAAEAKLKADTQHPDAIGSNFKAVGRLPGYGANSTLFEGSITSQNATGKTVTLGATAIGVVVGNVIVTASTVSSHSTVRGNKPAALSLLRAGIKHLQALQH